MTALQVVHILAGLVVLAEALNKIERTDLFDGRLGARARLVALGWVFVPWAWRRQHVVSALKVLGWAALALGGAGALARPWLHHEPPTADAVAVLAGFAILILRSRLKEG